MNGDRGFRDRGNGGKRMAHIRVVIRRCDNIVRAAAIACLLPVFSLAGTPYDITTDLVNNMPEEKTGAMASLRPGPVLAADMKVAGLLSDNRIPLESFRETAKAASDGYFLWPKPEDLSAKDAIPPLTGLTRLYRLALLDAAFRMSVNQPREAEKDLLAVAGLLGQLAHQGSGLLAKQMYLQLCFQRAYPLLELSVREKRASPVYLTELSLRLAAVENAQNGMESAFQDEKEFYGALFEKFRSQKLPLSTRLYVRFTSDTGFKDSVIASAKASLEEEARVYIDAVRTNSPEKIPAYREKTGKELKERAAARDRRGWWAVFMDAVRGGDENHKHMVQKAADKLLAAERPAYAELVPRYYVFMSHLRVLRAGLALNRYRRDRRRPPAGLEKLVPAYLAEVPADPYNNYQPLTYMKSGKCFTVYAFGPDKKSDKASAPFDWESYFKDASKNSGDIIFRN